MARGRAEGYGGGIYSLQPRTSRWVKGYPETPGICLETPDNPNFQPVNSHPDTPGNGVRSIRPYTRSIRVRQGKTSIFALLNCFVAHKCLSRFSWALVSSQHLWIKSLLIVRRSYTQNSNIKSNSMSILWTPLFHFLFEGSYIVTWFTYTNSPPAHTLNYTIKCTCVLSLTPKPT